MVSNLMRQQTQVILNSTTRTIYATMMFTGGKCLAKYIDTDLKTQR